jgi:serine/threonine-protein kinase
MDEAFFERRVGTIVRGKWTLEKLIGVGGMAAVYSAHHKIGRRDALKILHPEVAANAELRARFEQEAHAVNRFRHPGAVEIRDIDVTDEGAPFLVMELLEGEALSVRARSDEAVPHDEVLRLADEALDVLAAAHAEGIVHRDIKPDNLFILRDGRLKVLDFGIARMRMGGPGGPHTRTGAAIGTTSYMSPEQVKGRDVDGRADLFAVGATMFRLLTKRRIHDADSDVELMMKMANEPSPPLASVLPDVAPGLALVVDRALAYDRDRRYPDARTMQADVRAARAGQPPPFATARAEAGELPNVVPPASVAPSRMPAPGNDAPTRADQERPADAAPPSLRAAPGERTDGSSAAGALRLVEGTAMTATTAPVSSARPAAAESSKPNVIVLVGAAAVALLLAVLLIAVLFFRGKGSPSENGLDDSAPSASTTSTATKKKSDPGTPPTPTAAKTPDPGGATPPAAPPAPPAGGPPGQGKPHKNH